MTLRTDAAFYNGAIRVDAPYAADLISRIREGSLQRGVHSASEWYAVLSDRELQQLGRMARNVVERVCTDDRLFDVAMTVCLLRCLEDPTLPFPPEVERDAATVFTLAFALRVHCELTIHVRNGIFEAIEPFRILDERLPVRLTKVGDALLHSLERGPRWC